MKIISQVDLNIQMRGQLDGLIQQCRAADSCEPALQTLLNLNCHSDMKGWQLAFDDDRLIGVLTIFQPMAQEAEISGCVNPDYRRRGIFNALTKVGMSEVLSYGKPKFLWMLNRESQWGHIYLKKKGLSVYQTEYNMTYDHREPRAATQDMIPWRRAVASDIEDMARIQASAFKEKEKDAVAIVTRFFEDKSRENHIGFHADRAVAGVSVFVEGTTANINALAVEKELQGKGIGKKFMRQVMDHYLERGFEMTLSVHSENDRAFELYKTLGFQIVEAIDYYSE